MEKVFKGLAYFTCGLGMLHCIIQIVGEYFRQQRPFVYIMFLAMFAICLGIIVLLRREKD